MYMCSCYYSYLVASCTYTQVTIKANSWFVTKQYTGLIQIVGFIADVAMYVYILPPCRHARTGDRGIHIEGDSN